MRSRVCTSLVDAFIALNQLKKAGGLCKMVDNLKGFNEVCGSAGFDDEIDRKALCELLCCCAKNAPERPSACVTAVLWDVEDRMQNGGYFKADAPYRTDGSLITSRLNPDRATHAKPGGSRIPDVVVVNDPSKPPTIGNVRRVYEMKIGDDDFTNILGPDGKTQLDAFKKLFGDLLYQDKSGYQALTDESCGCKDDDDDNGGDGLLSRAKAHADELARQQSAEFTKAAKALAVPVLRAASQIPGPIGAAARVLGLGMGAASLAN